MLITLLLIEQKILPTPLLYLSAFFEAPRAEYYKQLYQVSAKGTWHEWFIYFLNGVAVQSEDVLSRAERINELLNEWQKQMTGISSQIPAEIVQQLAVNPYITTNKIAIELHIAYSTAQRAIQKLEAAGIIEKVSGNRRDKVYCAKKILTILEEPAKIQPNNETT